MTYSTGDFIDGYDHLLWLADWSVEDILGETYEESDIILGHYINMDSPEHSYYINMSTGKIVCTMFDNEEDEDSSHIEWSDTLE